MQQGQKIHIQVFVQLQSLGFYKYVKQTNKDLHIADLTNKDLQFADMGDIQSVP